MLFPLYLAQMPVTMTRKDYFERIKFPSTSPDAAHLVYLVARNRRITRRYVVERTALVVFASTLMEPVCLQSCGASRQTQPMIVTPLQRVLSGVRSAARRRTTAPGLCAALQTAAPDRQGETLMYILSTISRGKSPRHIFALIYGVDGYGKSTWASRALEKN
jgi:hypothetical protein